MERDGSRLTLHPTTVVSTVPDLDNARITKAGFLGVVPRPRRSARGRVRRHTMATGTWQTVQTIGPLPQKLYHVARAAVGLEERDVNGPISIVGAGRVAGEVASQHEVSVGDRAFQLLALLAGLNLFLGLVNLVPLPPFDGGGIATTLYETVRRAIARLRAARPRRRRQRQAAAGDLRDGGADPGDELILIYADIVAPVSLT